MTKFILELYATISAFSTIVYVGLGWASRKRSITDELERITEFDRSIMSRRSDYRPETGTASRALDSRDAAQPVIEIGSAIGALEPK